MARSWSARVGVVRVACVARLCQALIQPEMCLRGAGGPAGAVTIEVAAKAKSNDAEQTQWETLTREQKDRRAEVRRLKG